MKKILSIIVALVLISFQAQAGPSITQGINPAAIGAIGATTPAAGTFTLVTIGGTKYLSSTSSVLDDGTVTLPTVTATTGALYGVVLVSSAGIIDANASFIADSTGTVTLQIKGGSVVANADTDANLCIGTAVANPLTVKNRLGGAKTVTIVVWYN